MGMNKESKHIARRDCPHNVTVTMKVDIRKMNNDGLLEPEIIGNRLLEKYGITTKAQFSFNAVNEAEAIRILKAKMEKLNEWID